MPATTSEQVYDFLEVRRLAIVGVSRNPKDFSRMLMREFIDRRYEAIPVNPKAPDIDGFPCYRNVGEIDPVVEAALVMTSPKIVSQVVDDCLSAGIKKIWIYGLMGNPKANAEIVKKCAEQGVGVVSDLCPYMFFPQAGLLHRFHGSILKLMGRYPV